MDSDSDWDSLPGDPEPPSEYEVTPRPQQPPIAPAPPSSKSPRTQPHNGSNTSTPLRKAVKTPSKGSIPRTESSTNKPNQMYGKNSGVTSFVDNSNHSIRTLSDKNGSKKGSGESAKVDSNSNTVLSGNVDKNNKKASNALELKELDLNPVKDGQTNEGFHLTEEPPYTNFKDALPVNDVKESTYSPEQRRGKIKSAYLRGKTPENLDNISNLSTPRAGNDWDQIHHEDRHLKIDQFSLSQEPVDGPGHIVEMYGNEVCCPPYEKKSGTGYTYIFNHGKTNYLNVVPEWREPYMKALGERSERWLTYFWQEFFGVIALIVDFALIFLLELIKFTFHKVMVRLLVGFIVVFGDHLLKPVLAAVFNSLLQPSLAFLWNVFLGLRNGVRPLLDITREVVLQVTTLLKGFRLFELNWKPTFSNTENSSQILSGQFAYQQQIKEV